MITISRKGPVTDKSEEKQLSTGVLKGLRNATGCGYKDKSADKIYSCRERDVPRESGVY